VALQVDVDLFKDGIGQAFVADQDYWGKPMGLGFQGFSLGWGQLDDHGRLTKRVFADSR
jgi:hypothetical protein